MIIRHEKSNLKMSISFDKIFNITITVLSYFSILAPLYRKRLK
jgi:hypothetical protein